MPRLAASRQVLVVEADRVSSASLALKYALHGHYAKFAQSGSEAITLMSFFEPTLAILGTALPDLTGPELARIIEARCPACRIIFLSDHPSSHFSSKAAAAFYEGISEIVPIIAAEGMHTPAINGNKSATEDTF
jgi:DNA-binding NtrC family response regulator